VYDSSPKPAPLTVTLPDPVAAMFDILVSLNDETWIESTAVKLPTCAAAVAVTRRVPPALPSVLRLTAVSDSQPVLSEPVRPTRASSVAEYAPQPTPSTVRLEDPVAAPLARTIPLPTTLSQENALVWLLDTPPAVTAMRMDPTPPPCPVLHLVVESDSHTVLSHAVLAMSALCVLLPTPKPPPCTVTLTDPVAPAFARLHTLIDPRSVDSAAVHVPARWPAVTARRKLPCPPDADRQSNDVSAAHRLPSHSVMPPEADSECDICPRLVP
jgi:hypothetical protein